jgi:predicted PurR-regulated permease PerM
MLLVIGAITLAGGVLFAWSSVLFPIMAAFLIAYITHPLANFFEKRRLPRILSFLCVLLLLAGFIALFVLVFLPAFVHELMVFGQKFPQWREVIEKNISARVVDLQERYPEAYSLLKDKITDWAQENLPSMAPKAVRWLLGLLSSAAGIFSGLMSLALILVFTAYLTMDFHRVLDFLRGLIPRPVLPIIEKVTLDINQVMRDFLMGQLLVALALGVMYTIGLVISRTPLALIIGPMAGILALVPYLGLAVGFLLAFLLTFLEHPHLWQLGGVLITFTVAQTIEGWILTPKLLGDRVGLHPVWVMVALLFGAEFFGIPGIIVAVPVAAALRVILRHALHAYRESPIYLGSRKDAGN